MLFPNNEINISFLLIKNSLKFGKAPNIGALTLRLKKQPFFGYQKDKSKIITFDWLVCLSLARKILEIGPNGRNNSCRSDSLVSSDKLVTLIVADSSNKGKMKTINFSL